MRNSARALATLVVTIGLLAGIAAPVGLAAQTRESTCEGSYPVLERDWLADLYNGRAASGTEAEAVVSLLAEYGAGIDEGNLDRLLAVITPEFDATMGFNVCPQWFEEVKSDQRPDFHLTPLRVTTDDDGTSLAFIQRSYDDGSEDGYRDLFVVIAVEQADGSLLIDFALKDVLFTDNSTIDGNDLYLEGL